MPCHDKWGNRIMLLPYVYDDGGRSNYFKAKNVNDCVCRAVAIASGKDYMEVYKSMFDEGFTPRSGVFTRSVNFKRFMKEMGFKWVSLSSIGSHDSVHLVKGEMPPKGRFVCSVAKHYVAVVDGVVRDTWDSRYNAWQEPRRVYGCWEYMGSTD